MQINRFVFAIAFAAAAFAQQPGTISIDVQEWRNEPIRHLYVHGTLNGDTAFHVYLPEPARWKGRLFQYLQGGLGGSEKAGVRMGHHVYAMSNGGVYVESSQGHTGSTFYEPNNTPNELAYEASYSVVQYAKSHCVELYGREPKYTYIFGGSGGGVRSTGLIERFPKVYDGAVPVVGAGSVDYFIFLHSMFEAWRPLIQDKIPALAEATRVPGQGDPFSVLQTPQEKEALRMVLRTGFPRNSVWLIRPLVVGITVLDFTKYKAYPKYFQEFWTEPGYAGADGEVKNQIVEGVPGIVKSVTPEKRILTTDVDRKNFELYGYTLVFTSGASRGQWRRVLANQGSALVVGAVGPGVDEVRPGDHFVLDNRDLLAWRMLHRYIVDDPKDPAMTHLFVNGEPRYRQIPREHLAALTEPDRTVGKFAGKMIMMFGSDDPLMWPTIAVRYQRRVKERQGAETDQHYRLHFLQHGVHGAPFATALNRQIPNHAPVMKALDDMMAWVESGLAPVPGTNYSTDKLNQIVYPKTATLRQGYQPVVALSIQQHGAAATLTVTAEDPDNNLAGLDIDWDGDGKFDESKTVSGRSVKLDFQHHYDKSGTYYPTVRVTDATAGIGRTGPGIQNVGTAKVIVSQ